MGTERRNIFCEANDLKVLLDNNLVIRVNTVLIADGLYSEHYDLIDELNYVPVVEIEDIEGVKVLCDEYETEYIDTDVNPYHKIIKILDDTDDLDWRLDEDDIYYRSHCKYLKEIK